MQRNIYSCFILIVGASSYGCTNANYVNLPVASATIVHACAAAEADAHIRSAGGSPAITTTTIHVSAESDIGSDPKVTAGPTEALSAADLNLTKKNVKTVDIELKRLPSMSQCAVWGYLPQLGASGCLPSKDCRTATKLPPDAPLPPTPPAKPTPPGT